MAEGLVSSALVNLASLFQKELDLLKFVSQEEVNLASQLSTIRAVLKDAEEKQFTETSHSLKKWLRDLQHAVHVLDEILDDCSIEAMRKEHEEDRSCAFLSFLHPQSVMFRHSVSGRMKAIRKSLDQIAQERSRFVLSETVTEGRRVAEVPAWRETAPMITEDHVYGRDQDKEKVVGFLLGHDAAANNFTGTVPVYCVVGMGGLGKTILAQLVFNDEKVDKYFDLKMWVCVSDDFELKIVMKNIIESATEEKCEVSPNLDLLQKKLQKILQMKRYLLVLDDVWSEDPEKWNKLKHVLACGAKGSSVLVTTRKEKVATIMGTLPLQPHHLVGLSDDDSFSLFQNYAFGNGSERPENLVAIGRSIVEKCKGLPLAIKTMGSLLRFKSADERSWIRIKDSEIWNLPQGEDSVMAPLRLSYLDLSYTERRCFAYCAIFPKNLFIEKEKLIHLWMANGLISSNETLEVEDVGNEIVNELNSKSLVERVRRDEYGNTSGFMMHDLVHDLAKWVVEDECSSLDTYRPTKFSPKLRHLSVSNRCRLNDAAPLLDGVESLQTVVYQNDYYSRPASNTLSLLKHRSLRFLECLYLDPTELTSSISLLKHLRYLNLSYSKIKTLPDFICSLWNLQILKLNYCRDLESLPKRMVDLRNLRHLYLKGCLKLSVMPRNIGRLTELRSLSLLVLGESEEVGPSLSELGHLKHLSGELQIKKLERVRSVKHAQEANLASKQNLDGLSLSWTTGVNCDVDQQKQQILEALRPPPKLKHLTVEGYRCVSYPDWMMHDIASFNHMQFLELKSCRVSSRLPPLWTLPSLKELKLHALNDIVVDVSTGDACFRSLERLTVSTMSRLERISSTEDQAEADVGDAVTFPCLSQLKIKNCPKLKSLPPLPSLRKLDVDSIVPLRSISSTYNLQSLTELAISGIDESSYFHHDAILKSLNALEKLEIKLCHDLRSFPDQMFQGLRSLKRLEINHCNQLRFWLGSLEDLTSLQDLRIYGCPELLDLPKGIDCLTSLRRLTMNGYTSKTRTPELATLPEVIREIPFLRSLNIGSYPNLASLPEWLGDLASLEYLDVHNCPSVVSLPASVKDLANLNFLSISRCPQLQSRCLPETGEDWHKIAHVPTIILDDR